MPGYWDSLTECLVAAAPVVGSCTGLLVDYGGSAVILLNSRVILNQVGMRELLWCTVDCCESV
jgi:hypothetical protein